MNIFELFFSKSTHLYIYSSVSLSSLTSWPFLEVCCSGSMDGKHLAASMDAALRSGMNLSVVCL